MTDDDIIDRLALARLEQLGGPVLLRRMIESYLETGPERVLSMSDASAAGDAERVERAAHSMKTSAANLGATRVRELAEALERTAGAGTIDRELVEGLAREYELSAAALRLIAAEKP